MALDDLASEVTHCPFKQHSVPTETIPDSVREKIPQGHEYQEARLTGAISKAAHPSHQPTFSMDKSNCLFLPQFSLTLQEDLKIPLTNFPALVFLLENHYPKSKYNKKKRKEALHCFLLQLPLRLIFLCSLSPGSFILLSKCDLCLRLCHITIYSTPSQYHSPL